MLSNNIKIKILKISFSYCKAFRLNLQHIVNFLSIGFFTNRNEVFGEDNNYRQQFIL